MSNSEKPPADINPDNSHHFSESKTPRIVIGILAVLVVGFLGLNLFYFSKKDNLPQTQTELAGYTNKPVDEVASLLSPRKGFWLGETKFENTYLKQTNVPNNLETVLKSKEIKPILFIDYGTDSPYGTTVATYNTTDASFEKMIADCWRGDCPKDYNKVSTSIGEGIYKETSIGKRNYWEAKILVKEKGMPSQVVYVIDDSDNLRPDQVLNNLTAME